MSSPIGLNRVHHLELFVGNAKQAAYYYRKAFGFEQFAYLGPETGCHDRASYVMKQNDIYFVLSSPLTHESPMNVFLTIHGDSVRDIAFEVDDVDAAYNTALERGADSAMEPTDFEDSHGLVRKAAIHTYGETIHTFLSRTTYSGIFLPGFVAAPKSAESVGLLRIDHIVGNVEDLQMERWVEWYTRIFGFHQFVSYDDKDISTEFTALRSKVMASHDRKVKFPINEPARGRRKSQIQEYIDFHLTAGVQHIALYSDDIIETVSRLRKNGVEFLLVPGSYYDTIWDRVGVIDEDRERVREQQILVDRDEHGYLLQLFTKPVQDRPTLFLEVIQRHGCESFGKGNFKALFESIEREQDERGHL